MFAKATFYGKQPELRRGPSFAILHLHDREWVYSPVSSRQFRRLEVVTGEHASRQQQEIFSGSSPEYKVIADALDIPEHSRTVMIRKLVDFALENRLLVLALALMLFLWGAVSFHQLPVEAYPDVANNYVEIITQWPGISAEQVEQQVTIPLEIVMNGIPHVAHLRSFSLFGLSDLKLIFDDDRTTPKIARESWSGFPRYFAAGVDPQMGTDWSPVGQIYFFTLHSTNPQYDVMELKSIEDWVVEKNLKAVPESWTYRVSAVQRANTRSGLIPIS